MADIKFSQLPYLTGANVTINTTVPVVENGFNWQLTAGNLQAFVLSDPGANITANNITANTVTSSSFVGGTFTGTTVTSNTVDSNFVNGNIITANVFSGGSFVYANGVPVGNYSNANVQSYLSSGTDNANIITTGNISGSYVLGNGRFLSGMPVIYGNANVSNYLASGTDTANIVTTGNISGSYLLGNGRFIAGLAPTYGDANVSSYLASGTDTANIITSGNIRATNMSILNNTVSTNITATNYVTLSPYSEKTVNMGNVTGSFTPSGTDGTIQSILVTGSFTLQTPVNMSPGQNICLIVTQDSVGTRVMTPVSSYKFAGGVNTLSTLANSVDTISIFYTGTTYLAVLTKGYI